MSPLEILFVRKPRIPLDTLTAQLDGADTAEGPGGFVERRQQVLRKVKSALERRYEEKVASRVKKNAMIVRTLPGVLTQPCNLVLVREAECTLNRSGRGATLKRERWTGPWEVKKVLQEGLSVEVGMQGRQLRRRRESTTLVKPVYKRSAALRHPMADEFAQQA